MGIAPACGGEPTGVRHGETEENSPEHRVSMGGSSSGAARRSGGGAGPVGHAPKPKRHDAAGRGGL